MADAPDLPLEHETIEPREPTDGPAPAVIVLHGRGADERDLLPVARALPDPLRVVSLRAPTPMGRGYTWYDLDLPGGDLHHSQPVPEDFRESLDLVAGSVDAATDAYGLDPDRIGVLGFSQGAVVALSSLLEAPRYAWVVALHGYLPATHEGMDPDGADGLPVFVGTGSADEVIPAARSEAAADALRDVGCAVTFERFETGHGVGPSELEAVSEWVADRHRQA